MRVSRRPEFPALTGATPVVFECVIKSNLDENKTAAASRCYLGFCNLKCGINLEFGVENAEKLKTDFLYFCTQQSLLAVFFETRFRHETDVF